MKTELVTNLKRKATRILSDMRDPETAYARSVGSRPPTDHLIVLGVRAEGAFSPVLCDPLLRFRWPELEQLAAAHPERQIRVKINVQSVGSVRLAAEQVAAKETRVGLLVNDAGVT